VSYSTRYKYVESGKIGFFTLSDFSSDQLEQIPKKSWGSEIKDEQVLYLLYRKNLSFEDLNNIIDPSEFF
jgi:hypothetical protein